MLNPFLNIYQSFPQRMTKNFDGSSPKKIEINTFFICAIFLGYSNYLCIHVAVKEQSRTYKV